jgi:hypothetical protein
VSDISARLWSFFLKKILKMGRSLEDISIIKPTPINCPVRVF